MSINLVLLCHTPNPEEVVTLGGKLCYSAVGVNELKEKQSPEDIARFVKMLADIGHESPLEHINFTFGVEGISRSCSHQIVRHRIASYSQQSQRYVNLKDKFEYITPSRIKRVGYINQRFVKSMNNAFEDYVAIAKDLLDVSIYEFLVEEKGLYSPDTPIELLEKVMKEEYKAKYREFMKMAIEDARAVLPNACETKMVFTMNARSLLNFFHKRDCNRSQEEIREMARLMIALVQKVAPSLFSNCGADCRYGKCGEGDMCCKNPLPKWEDIQNK